MGFLPNDAKNILPAAGLRHRCVYRLLQAIVVCVSIRLLSVYAYVFSSVLPAHMRVL